MGKFIKVRISDWTMDFRIINYQDASEFGVCYVGTKQVWITLHRMESEAQIIDTILHEAIHQAICDKTVGEDESVNMDGEQEHELMKRLFWFNNDWV
jgi:hypothetical protein